MPVESTPDAGDEATVRLEHPGNRAKREAMYSGPVSGHSRPSSRALIEDQSTSDLFLSTPEDPSSLPTVQYHDGKFPSEGRLDWQILIPLIRPAYGAVARYDGMLAAIPNPQVRLAPLTTREAVLSSRIEGTQATMGEALEYEAGHRSSSKERHDDIREVLNYRTALRTAERMLEKLPLSSRVIRQAHKTLLSGVRHEQGAGSLSADTKLDWPARTHDRTCQVRAD